MSMKSPLQVVLLILAAVGLGLVGCSEDTERITTTGSSSLTDQLATDYDWPATNLDVEDYISQGYYYPEEDSAEDSDQEASEEQESDDPFHKPIDGGGLFR